MSREHVIVIHDGEIICTAEGRDALLARSEPAPGDVTMALGMTVRVVEQVEMDLLQYRMLHDVVLPETPGPVDLAGVERMAQFLENHGGPPRARPESGFDGGLPRVFVDGSLPGVDDAARRLRTRFQLGHDAPVVICGAPLDAASLDGISMGALDHLIPETGGFLEYHPRAKPSAPEEARRAPPSPPTYSPPPVRTGNRERERWRKRQERASVKSVKRRT